MNKSDKLILSRFFEIESDQHINLSDSKREKKKKQIEKIHKSIWNYIESSQTKSLFYIFSACSNGDFDKGIILRNYNNRSKLTFTPEVKIIDICYCSDSFRITLNKKDSKSNILKNHKCSCNTFINIDKLSVF